MLGLQRACGRWLRSEAGDFGGRDLSAAQASTVMDVPGDVPFVQLPDRIELSLDEVSAVLEVLDIAEAAARNDGERVDAREAIRIVTSKLWPELGDLLDRDEDE